MAGGRTRCFVRKGARKPEAATTSSVPSSWVRAEKMSGGLLEVCAGRAPRCTGWKRAPRYLAAYAQEGGDGGVIGERPGGYPTARNQLPNTSRRIAAVIEVHSIGITHRRRAGQIKPTGLWTPG